MYKGKRIIAVLASYNEAGKIGKGVAKIPRHLVDEVVVVNDCSTDDTEKEARQAGATVLNHQVNMGAGAGYRDGYYYGLEKNYDVIVELAGDDQDIPDEIPRLLDAVIDENYDYVHGSRWLRGGKRLHHPWHRLFSTWLYSFIFSIFVGKRATDATNGFRAFKAGILKDERINLKQDWLNRYEMEPYFYFKVIRLGYRWKEVPCTKYYPPHDIGYTKMVPLVSWWSILRPIFLLGFGLKK